MENSLLDFPEKLPFWKRFSQKDILKIAGITLGAILGLILLLWLFRTKKDDVKPDEGDDQGPFSFQRYQKRLENIKNDEIKTCDAFYKHWVDKWVPSHVHTTFFVEARHKEQCAFLEGSEGSGVSSKLHIFSDFYRSDTFIKSCRKDSDKMRTSDFIKAIFKRALELTKQPSIGGIKRFLQSIASVSHSLSELRTIKDGKTSKSLFFDVTSLLTFKDLSHYKDESKLTELKGLFKKLVKLEFGIADELLDKYVEIIIGFEAKIAEGLSMKQAININYATSYDAQELDLTPLWKKFDTKPKADPKGDEEKENNPFFEFFKELQINTLLKSDIINKEIFKDFDEHSMATILTLFAFKMSPHSFINGAYASLITGNFDQNDNVTNKYDTCAVDRDIYYNVYENFTPARWETNACNADRFTKIFEEFQKELVVRVQKSNNLAKHKSAIEKLKQMKVGIMNPGEFRFANDKLYSNVNHVNADGHTKYPDQYFDAGSVFNDVLRAFEQPFGGEEENNTIVRMHEQPIYNIETNTLLVPAAYIQHTFFKFVDTDPYVPITMFGYAFAREMLRVFTKTALEIDIKGNKKASLDEVDDELKGSMKKFSDCLAPSFSKLLNDQHSGLDEQIRKFEVENARELLAIDVLAMTFSFDVSETVAGKHKRLSEFKDWVGSKNFFWQMTASVLANTDLPFRVKNTYFTTGRLPAKYILDFVAGQSKQYASTFSCSEGSAMAPKERCNFE